MPATYGVAADAVSYTSAISGCERAGEWMAAVQLFRQMRDAGVNPTMLTYSKLLFVHAAAGQWEAAVGFIEAATADGLLHNPLTLNPNPSPDPDPNPNPNPTPTLTRSAAQPPHAQPDAPGVPRRRQCGGGGGGARGDPTRAALRHGRRARLGLGLGLGLGNPNQP